MKFRADILTMIIIFSGMFLFSAYSQESKAQTPDELYNRAVKEYNEKSFSRCLGVIEEFKKQYPKDKNIPEIRYKEGACLLQLERLEEAKQVFTKMIKDYPDEIWGGYAEIYLARILKSLDRWNNIENIIIGFNSGIKILDKYSGSKEVTNEIIIALFDLAETEFSKWRGAEEATKETTRPFFETFDKIKKYTQNEEILAKAEYYKADYFRDIVNSSDKKYDERIKLYRAVVEKYPKSQYASESLYEIGTILLQREKYVEAVAEFDNLIKSYPGSSFKERAVIEKNNIINPGIGINVSKVFSPAEIPVISISSRNIPKIYFDIYRTDLFDLMKKNKSLADIKDLKNFQKVQSFTMDDTGADKHIPYYEKEKKLPKLERGAYIISAYGEGAESTVLMLVTDLAVGSKNYQNKFLTFVCNAKTGKPASHSEVMYAYNYTFVDESAKSSSISRSPAFNPQQSKKGRYEYQTQSMNKTDVNGLFTWTLEKADLNNRGVLIIAKDGENNFAICNQSEYYPYYTNQINQKNSMIYFYTERPVYRPDQKMNFKGILRGETEGKYENLPKQPVQIEIRDPQGKEAFKTTLETNEYGTFTGEYLIPSKPPLGSYSVRCIYSERDSYFEFRIEEYKKPEFKVTVQAPAEQIRLGEEVAAVCNADYYFGGPVENAVVEYTVFREMDYFYPRFMDFTYEWLGDIDEPADNYDGGYSSRMMPGYGGDSEVVIKGETFTNNKGGFNIYFKTEKKYTDISQAPEYMREYLKRNGEKWKYIIEAKVTDKSRRQVTGASEIKVTEKAFSVSMNTEKYLYKPGEKVKITIKSENANGKPVECAGKIIIYSAKYNAAKENYEFTEKFTSEVKIDKTGETLFPWTCDEGGYYKIIFDTMDQYENQIQGEHWIWVCDEAFRGTNYLVKNIEIITDKKIYAIGETANILINSQFPDSYIFFTIDSDKDVLKKEVFALSGTSKMFSIKVRDNFSPNVFLKVVMVNGYQVFQDKTGIRVPPENKILNVVVQGGKDRYSPGEKADFDVIVKDQNGAPVECEFSIGFADDAIYYIQEDTTEDIRKFFYGKSRYDSINISTSFEYHQGGYPSSMHNYMAMDSYVTLSDSSSSDMKWSFAKTEAVAAPAPRGMGMAKEQKLKEPEIRKDFRDTAFWSPSKITDKNGKTKITVSFPDSLTTWRINAKAITKTTQVGSLKSNTVVSKNIIVRLQSPRFFIERDEPVISAIVHNYLKEDKEIKTIIECKGIEIDESNKEKTVKVAKGGSARVEFPVKVTDSKSGEAYIKVSALTDVESDAMEMKYPIYPHGIEKFIARSGMMDKKTSAEEILNLPKKEFFSRACLEINIAPTAATAMVDALGYLADYPYGCVEQTMSRFIPCVVTLKTIQELKMPAPPISEKLPDMIEVGLRRIYDFQLPSGGWGWWKHDNPDPYMTAYVVYGLALAQTADIEVNQEILEKAQQILLKAAYNQNTDINLKSFILFALSYSKTTNDKALEDVWSEREKLNDYSRALLAITLYNLGQNKKAETIIRNLEDFARIDKENGTVSWAREGVYYSWYEDGVEATAMALQAFSLIQKDHEWTPMIAKWLLNNRKGNRWKSSKDTAIVVLALNQYIRAKQEMTRNCKIKIYLSDKLVKEAVVTPENIWSSDFKLTFKNEEIPEGRVPVRIEREGGSSVYYSAYLKYFSTEEDLKGAGNEIFVEREYFRIIKKVTPDKKLSEERIPIKYNDLVNTEEEIEAVIKIRAKNNYEYLMFEDMKPSSCEPIQLKSGYAYGNGLCSNMELRDEKVVFFISHLNQGEHSISYRMRVEFPGKFHVIPTNAGAMYVPEIRAISNEFRFSSEDKK